MKIVLLLSTLTFLIQAPTANADPKSWMFQKLQRDKLSKKADSSDLSGYDSSRNLLTSGSFDQITDHFAANPKALLTFKQRYFIDATFAENKDSPVIYYICGEGACEGASGTPEVDDIARKTHAYRVALEHRYYGTSQPFATLETKNLVYLSMSQAIEDLATFQIHVQKSMGLSGKWISMGGSYAGELSAFYRLKHPELVAGALASSGPVLAKADFFEYDRHIARVAGPVCLKAIQKVVVDVEQRLKNPESAAQVKKMFNAVEYTNDVDFLYVVADMAAVAIQYGYEKNFCPPITQAATSTKATEAYAKAGTNLLSEVFHMKPADDWVPGAVSTNPSDYPGVGMRSWLYQSCTEFGYYQTANPNRKESSRSVKVSLAYHDQMCERLFGITKPVDTAATNRTFYDQLFNSSVRNIFF
ncbi:MAG: septum formation initiator, partial [Bdellovibrionales bacterium]|nr:septum formation initiator [Oligoflexia bacterium]